MKFLIFTLTGWEEPPRTRHQVTRALANSGHEVIFVTRNKVGKIHTIGKKITDKIFLIEPYFPLNYRFCYRIPVINEIYHRWLFNKLRQDYSDYTVINFDFTAHQLSRYFKYYIYYCNDIYVGNSKYPNWLTNAYHNLCEKRVIKKAVFCISTAEYISKRLEKFNHHVFLIPLGGPKINYDHTKVDMMVRSDKVLHIGLMGFITLRNISYRLINQILQEKDMVLYIIGPVEDSFLKKLIVQHDNLVIKGTLIGEELYKQLNSFDVTIAPYDLRRINKGTTPNKMWQYLAIGKPVIISNLPNLRNHSFPEKIIYLAPTDKDFITLIRKAHRENSPELIKKRIEITINNSWNKRIENLLDIFSRYNEFKEDVK